jgi:methylenetetrahydrofolate reductase (NADPH)
VSTATGTTQRTYQTVAWIRTHLGQSGRGAARDRRRATRQSLRALLAGYRSLGVGHLVAIRGDLSAGATGLSGEFPRASDLVAFIRDETGNHFHVEVAAHPEFHPEAASADAELERFARKVAAGANSALTLHFCNADAYFHFVEWCQHRGLSLRIVPGVMRTTGCDGLAHFSAGAGVEISR